MRITVTALLLLVLFGLGPARVAAQRDCKGLDCFRPPRVCNVGVCFSNPAAESAFEKDNNCRFGQLCGSQIIRPETQCCGRDPVAGDPAPQTKVATTLDSNFNWADYAQRCPNKRQSEAPPNALWQRCVVGQRHSPTDVYPIVEVVQNGAARPYCIDGCSTPPGVVKAMYNAEVALTLDKDNPSGFPGASFFSACAAHDKCYQTCNAGTKPSCDDHLFAQMLQACSVIPPHHRTTINLFGISHAVNTRDRCNTSAETVYAGVQLGGAPAFKLRRQQYCQCC